MENIYIKIKVKKNYKTLEELREEGLLFSNISEALDIEPTSVIEIDESNYKTEILNIKKKWKKNGI